MSNNVTASFVRKKFQEIIDGWRVQLLEKHKKKSVKATAHLLETFDLYTRYIQADKTKYKGEPLTVDEFNYYYTQATTLINMLDDINPQNILRKKSYSSGFYKTEISVTPTEIESFKYDIAQLKQGLVTQGLINALRAAESNRESHSRSIGSAPPGPSFNHSEFANIFARSRNDSPPPSSDIEEFPNTPRIPATIRNAALGPTSRNNASKPPRIIYTPRNASNPSRITNTSRRILPNHPRNRNGKIIVDPKRTLAKQIMVVNQSIVATELKIEDLTGQRNGLISSTKTMANINTELSNAIRNLAADKCELTRLQKEAAKIPGYDPFTIINNGRQNTRRRSSSTNLLENIPLMFPPLTEGGTRKKKRTPK